MAAQNRDKESLYPPGKLSVHFAAWSTLLLVTLVWMLWQDYDRPWKDYQRAFRTKQLDVAIQKRRHTDATNADLKGLLAAEKQAQQRLAEFLETNAELKALEAKMPALGQAKFDAEKYEKYVKGLVSPARYQYEIALAGEEAGSLTPGTAEEKRHEFNRLASEQFRAHNASAAAQADYDAVHDRIAAVRAPYEKAVKDAGKSLIDYRGMEVAVAGLEQKFERNQWRNWPVIDFISSTLQIKQVVLKNIHDNWNFATNVKVDRCMTCHLGVDNPDMSDEAIAEVYADEIAKAYGDDPKALEKFKAQHGFEGWMQPHPALSLISGPSSKHKVEQVGCTVCHAGVGWSTDFSRAAHTARSDAQLKEWERTRDRKPPEFVDFPMLAREYVQGQCFKCLKQGFGWPVVYTERLDHGATWVNDRGDDERVWQFHDDVTGGKRLLPPLEMYGNDLRLPEAPGPVDGPRSAVARVRRAQELARLEKHFQQYADIHELDAEKRLALRNLSKDPMVRDFGWDAAAYDKGEETIIRYGCQGCHKIADFGEQIGFASWPRIAPDLSYVGDKVTPAWLERWIKHPDAYRPDTRMPSFFWFTPKNHDWQWIDREGRLLAAPKPVPVLDSHLWDKDEKIRELGPLATPQDEARMSVQIAAIALFLRSQGRSHADKADPAFEADYLKDPPAGDWEKGREAVGNEGYGCVACHVVPEVMDAGGKWVPDAGERFRGEPAKGPRINTLGTKLLWDGPGEPTAERRSKASRWLNAWLKRPKHYTSTTQMPNMRWRDVVAPDGTVVRTAEQVRADVVAYLLRYRDAAFEALPGVGWNDSWNDILQDFYEEFFGRNGAGDLRRGSEVEGEFKANRDLALVRVGERLMARNGCFGCHAVKGHEDDQPVGTELSREGIKDLHQLEFAYVHEVPHTRAEFIRKKITHPRVWDHGRVKRWTDQLKMPRFNFRMDDGVEGEISTRASVAGIVLGLVEEPIKEGALYKPDDAARDVIRFRKVVQRYGCNNCHPIEGQVSVLWRFLGAGYETGEIGPDGPVSVAPKGGAFDLKFVVPSLFAEGERRKADWLIQFLQDPLDLRPRVRQRMPKFELSEAEADALVRGFQRLAGIKILNRPQPKSHLEGNTYKEPLNLQVTDDQGKVVATRTVHDAVEEAEFLFDTINCNKCHLPLGSPGADPQDGGVSPPFRVVGESLTWGFVYTLLNEPKHLIHGTAMPSFWERSGYGRVIDPKYAAFQLRLRDDATWQALWKACDQGRKACPERDEASVRLVEAQREALADYVTHHYRYPHTQTAEPR